MSAESQRTTSSVYMRLIRLAIRRVIRGICARFTRGISRCSENDEIGRWREHAAITPTQKRLRRCVVGHIKCEPAVPVSTLELALDEAIHGRSAPGAPVDGSGAPLGIRVAHAAETTEGDGIGIFTHR